MLRLLAGSAAVLLLTACSSGDDPSAQAPAVASPPAGFASYSIGDVTFSAPSSWDEVEAGTAAVPVTGEQEVALRAPAEDEESAPVALAVLDPSPSRDAAAEVDALLTVKRDVQKVPVRTETLALPGFASAELLAYDEDLVTGERLHTDVLVGELDDGTLVTLTVKAETALFGQLQLGSVVRSARAATPA